jgi:hypothetical protein
MYTVFSSDLAPDDAGLELLRPALNLQQKAAYTPSARTLASQAAHG